MLLLTHHPRPKARPVIAQPKEPIHRRLLEAIRECPGATTKQLAAVHETIPRRLLHHYLRHLRLMGWRR